ncbi:MAG: single-stranded DNA-binding protein [Blastochloris sp.]|nr:single-stranded DNA-binding protein [Blastochloris sp.]
MRFTTQGTAVTTFRVAANYGDDTEWFRVVAWERLAEVCNEYLRHGAWVYVEGRIRTRKWQDREGHDRSTTEVVAHEMILLSAKAMDPMEEPEHATPPPSAARPPTRRRPKAVPEEDLPF